jgi:cytoskeleton protein RodZ
VQGIGIGPALRKARLLRGKSIEEASRETRIRAEYLQALEGERFETLLGAVYVRGFLRSYSTYLGLDADKVLSFYNRHFGVPRPTLPEPSPGPVRRPHSAHPRLPQAFRMHPNWAFLIAAAIAVLGVLGAVGVLRSRSAPAPATAPSGGSPIPALPPTVTVDLLATAPVQVVVTTDGVVNFQGMLRTDESRSFDASTKIEIQLDPGGVTVVTVNGHRVGKPGPKGGTYARIFYPKDFRRSPSPNAP